MGHTHNHSQSTDNLKTAFFLNVVFTLLELFGGWFVNSVAIMSDAIHDLGDSLSLGLAWYLQIKSRQKETASFSFGYARFSLLGALVNGVILLGGSFFVLQEAWQRILQPETVQVPGMLVFAFIGVVVNGYAAWRVSHGKTANEQMVSWHLLEDVLGWVAVFIGGVLMFFWDLPFLDPALSIMITMFILWNVFKRLKETLYLFLQGTPHEVDLAKIESMILKETNVQSVHHTHVWSLDGESHVFSSHLVFGEDTDLPKALASKNKVKKMLAPYHFSHCTLELEWSEDCSIG